MKRSFISILLLAAAVVSANAVGIKWAKAYDNAKAESKATGRLIMIDFYTDWCGWCKKLDADTYPAPEVVAQSEKFVPIKLDAEKDKEGVRLAKKFKVTGYPTVLFIDADENLAYKIVGYAPAKPFSESMSKASTIREDKAKFEGVLKTSPNDTEASLGLAGIYASLGDMKKAASLVDGAAGSVPADKKGKLIDAYNALGDGYQNDGQLDKAVPYFEKAIDAGFPTQAAYARISIAVCYMGMNKPKLAVPVLEDLLKMGKEADDYRSDAQKMLDAAKKAG